MFSRRLKTGFFVVEGLHSFGTVFYFYYFYFFMQQQFGFGNKANLILAALNGATYALAAFAGGKLAQRFGYLRILKLGFVIMCVVLASGAQVGSATGHILVMVLAVVGMSMTWPALEALVSEGETRTGVQLMVGIYNVVWAATAAVGNFIGGALLFWLGMRSLFYVPAANLLVMLGLTVILERQVRRKLKTDISGTPVLISKPLGSEVHPVPPERTRSFLRMAWLVNPFAYIGINTLIAVMPGIALRLELSTAQAGFCGSVWCFARLGAFALFWLWPGWHYRFRWLLLSYVGLAGSFMVVLLAPNIAMLVLAQLLFGTAVGLIYYSSLYYSMDSSETKGEHGGIHEAAIGVGNFAGPAVGAAALQFLPQYTHSGAYGVSLLLLCGLGGLTWLWQSGQRSGGAGRARSGVE